MRKRTKTIKVGNVLIGGDAPVSIQSMTNTDTSDYDCTFNQLIALKQAGCDIARLAVRNESDVEVCSRYVKDIDMPLVADIQFDYKLAVASADAGFAKIRFNPGNTSSSNLAEVVKACKSNNCAIRIGINAGSLEPDLKKEYGVTAKSLTMSAMRSVYALEDLGFKDTVISVKASDVRLMKESYEMLSDITDYPLHLGVTESGSGNMGLIKSTAGIASLLLEGIGDTIRVSLTGNPVNEINAAIDILNVIGLRSDRPEIISCPTCARCFYDLESMARKCEDITRNCRKKIKIAVMGCVVNGPGEASDADIGIAGGKDKAILFEKGKIIDTLPTKEAEKKFILMLEELIK